MESFNLVAGIASIAGFFVSLIGIFLASKILRIIDSSKTSNKNKNITIGGDYVGRDKK